MPSDARLHAAKQAAPIFSARLTPHTALSARGMKIVVLLVALLAAIPGLVFYSMGAWPVVGFMGLDVLAVWWALSRSRHNGKRFEDVTLWCDNLEVLQVDANGRESKSTFNPFYVRLIIHRDIEERTTSLRLRTKDRELEIGSFLNPEDKSSFGKVFGTALRKARS